MTLGPAPGLAYALRMRGVRLLSGFALAGFVWACTGGPGTPILPASEHEPAGSTIGQEPGQTGPEPGATGPEPANPIGNPSPGSSSSSGSGSSSGGGACTYCGKTYSCSYAGGSTGFTVSLQSSEEGSCAFTTDEDGGVPGTFSCDGTFTSNGTSYSWTSDGAGGFTFTVSITAGGQTVSGGATCDPS